MSHDGHNHPHPHPGQAMNMPSPDAAAGVPDELIRLYSLAIDKNVVTDKKGEVDPAELGALNNIIQSLIGINDGPQALPPGIPQQFLMTEYIPPPPQPIPNLRSNHIAKAREDGNTFFRNQKYADAIKHYTLSAHLSATRPTFESGQYSRDELSLALCNRSAAYAAKGEYIEALVDANAVIALKRPFTKGYFRKAKALAALGWYTEAKDALLLGLEFEPANEDLSSALADLEKNAPGAKKLAATATT
ncbi:hypothetical protein EMMF5_000589 [Cystobasidiomycetes sp. EMM_F5]